MKYWCYWGLVGFFISSCSTSSFVKENRLLIAEGKSKEAIKNYHAYIQEDPHDSQIYFNLAEVYLQLKSYKEAEKYIKKAVILEEQVSEYRLLAGKIAYYNQNYFEAINYLSSTLILDNTLLEAYYYLALSFEKTGKTSDAVAQLNSVISLEPLYFKARLAQIRILFERKEDKKNFEALISRLKKALKLVPGSAEGVLLLSRLYYTYGETYKSRQVLIEWLKEFSKNDDVLYALANLQFLEGLKREANKAIEMISVPTLKTDILKTRLALSLNQTKGLLERVQTLEDKFGKSSTFSTLKGEVLLSLGKLDIAERSLQEAVQADALNSKAYILLSKVWELQGDIQGAGRALESAVKANPNDFQVRIYYLKKLVELGNIERAMELIEGYHLDESNADVLFLKAVIASYQGDYDRSDQYLKRAQREAYSPRVEVQFAKSEIRRGRLASAESRLKRVLKLYPNYLDAIPAQGEVLYRKGDFKLMIEFLTPFLANKKFNGKLHQWVAEAYLQLERVEKAEAVLKIGVSYWPSQIELIQMYTMILGLQKKYKSAISILEEAQQYNHKYKDLFHHRLTQYYYYTGLTKKLRKYQYKYKVTQDAHRFNSYLYRYILKKQEPCISPAMDIGKVENKSEKNLSKSTR